MLSEIVQLVVGAAGTALYLLFWRRIQGWAGDPESRRHRQRRRLLQTAFFLLLTPYVLILFAVMDRLSGWIGAAG